MSSLRGEIPIAKDNSYIGRNTLVKKTIIPQATYDKIKEQIVARQK